MTLITLSFDGAVSARNTRGRTSFAGKLYWARPGDVVFSKIDVRNGAIGIIPEDLGDVAVSDEFPVYELASDEVHPDYLRLLLRTRHFLHTLNTMISGASGRKRITPAQFEALKVPLPSLHEQLRIIDWWREGEAEVDRLRGEGIRAIEQVPAYLLEALGMPANAEEYRPQRVAKISSRQLDRWSVDYLSRSASGFEETQQARYDVKELGEIADITYGIQKGPQNRPGAHARPYLRVANVQSGALDLSEIKYINVPDADLERFRLEPGDLLVCEGNSAEHVGRPAIWNGEIPDCVHQNHVLRVRVNDGMALPEFVLEYMLTHPAKRHFRSRAKFTTNLASINSHDLKELLMPVPPLEVQEDMLKEISEMRQHAEELLRLAAYTQDSVYRTLEKALTNGDLESLKPVFD